MIRKAEQVDGSPDALVRKTMAEDGPPFLFATDDEIEVGQVFELAGQPMVILRLCSREEFVRRAVETNNAAMLRGASAHYTFFEAATD